MKRLLALVLIAMLLVSASAFAEDRPYMQQIQQDTYVYTLFITPESYPEARLSLDYLDWIACGYSEPWVIRFGAPDDCFPISFDETDCAYVHESNGTMYYYEALEDCSYESQLYECQNEDYIVADGSEGYAAYVEPDRGFAYGLVGLPEISETAMLYITIYMGDLLYYETEEQSAEVLAEAVSAECARIMGEKTVQLEEDFWTSNAYCGLKMPSLDYESCMMVLDFPTLPIAAEDGSTVEVEAYLYALEDNDANLFAAAGENTLDLEVELTTYTYLEYEKEEDPANCTTVTLADGTVFDVYLYNLAENGESSLVYCSTLLADDAGYDQDENLYLELCFDGDGVEWTSVDEFAELLEIFMQGVSFTDVNSDPYVPGEDLTAGGSAADDGEPVDEAAAANWVCVSCNAENTGNFCTNCGAAKPAANWVCPSCSAENDGNFCSNCGTKRP